MSKCTILEVDLLRYLCVQHPIIKLNDLFWLVHIMLFGIGNCWEVSNSILPV